MQLLLFNEEFLVVVIHQIATITSLPFVHTARRYYRLNGLVRPPDPMALWRKPHGSLGEAGQTWSFRGSKSRNKVSVGEPAEGSFMNDFGLQPFPPLWSISRAFGPLWPALMQLTLSDTLMKIKTFNKGSLGSCIDEERSKARNVL